MTFEERMERLAERHEALAQTFEMHNAILLRLEATEEHDRAMMQSLTNKQADLTAAQDRLTAAQDRLTVTQDRMLATQREQNMTANHQREMLDGLLLATDRVLKATDQMVLVAGRHDARLNRLEKS